MKSVLVIGLGRFGTCFAKKMMQLGNEVMAMDISEERVNEIAPVSYTHLVPQKAVWGQG